MPEQLSLLTRRRLSPQKLRQARLNAGFDNMSEVARRIGIRYLAYSRWEREPSVVYVDFVAFHNALVLFGVSYEDITDKLPQDQDVLTDGPAAPHSLKHATLHHAEAQAGAGQGGTA